ncbi:hypothetical protein ACET3Z_013816 [Daucus carota]
MMYEAQRADKGYRNWGFFRLSILQDLAKAFIEVLCNEKVMKQSFNISGNKYVTFYGLARACAKDGGFPEPELVHTIPKNSVL